ncbi:hypothetical protein [Erythrobacter donghaensis]|uniref:hypothetical protein n=1 Tax=Erythrobacter donghaensis TaxID=267135 RepID=UPI00117F123C|nr:hypothetical protein [Erythrobacter donghaensis]
MLALAVTLRPALAQTAEPDAARLAALEAGCAQGTNADCEALRVHFGRGMDTREKFAFYTRRACETGSARQCTVYAARSSVGATGFPPSNRALQAEFALRACRGGDADGCGLAGLMANRSNPYSEADRTFIHNRVCEIGTASDCGKAAYAMGEAQQWERAYTPAQRACSRGDANSCTNVGAYRARSDNAQRALARREQERARSAAQSAPPPPPSTANTAPSSNAAAGIESCITPAGTRGTRAFSTSNGQRIHGRCS